MAQEVPATHSVASGKKVYLGYFPAASVSGSAGWAPFGAAGSVASSAPLPSSPYRSEQPYLFQPVDANLRAEQITGGGAYSPDLWGPHPLYVDFQSGWAWANVGGDYIDAALVSQGATAWGSVATPTGSIGTVYDHSITCTTLLQNVQANARWCAIKLVASSAPRVIAGVFYTDPAKRPRIDVTYVGGATATLACRVSAFAGTGNTSPLTTTGELTLPVFLEFDKPTAAVAAATLRFSVTQQNWSGSPTDVKIAGILTPPLNTDPVTGTAGLASLAGPLDAGITSVSGVLGAHRYNDGSVLADYLVEDLTKSKSSESDYDPAIWGRGPQDLSKLPHTTAGKWFRGASSQPHPAPVLVSSSYTGEGFVPLAPGMGALKVTMPALPVVPGQEVTNNGRVAADMLLMLPDAQFGLLDHIFVRYYVRLGTPYSITPANRPQILSSGAVRWTDLSGKMGIGPGHATNDGGVSGSSGGGKGWQMRHTFIDADIGLGGPDEGGVTQGFHLYDFQGNNPVGHQYGVEQPVQFERWGQRGGLGGLLYAGHWQEVETELKLNSINIGAGTYSADGELRAWIGGRLVYERTNMVFRTAPVYAPAYNGSRIRACRELGIKEIWLNWFHGGQSENTVDRTVFYAGLVWGTSRIGAMKSAAPAWVQSQTLNTWGVVPTSNFLTDLDPDLDPAVNPNYPATSGGQPVSPWRPAGVSSGHFVNMTDWCGAIQRDDVPEMWWVDAGGHNSMWDAASYKLELDLETPRYTRVSTPSGAVGRPPLDYVAEMARGTFALDMNGRPRCKHTVNMQCWWPGKGPVTGSEILLANSGGAEFGVSRPYLTSPTTGDMIYRGANNANNGAGGWDAVCYDSLRNVMWKMPTSTSTPFSKWGGPDNDVWTQVGIARNFSGSCALTYIPGLDLILVANGGGYYPRESSPQTIVGGFGVFDPATGELYARGVTSTYPTFTGAPTSAPAAFANGLFPGITQPRWVPSLGALLAWDNITSRTQIMRITPPASGDPRTGTWTIDYLTVAGSNAVTPTAALVPGTHGRFAVYDDLGVAVVQNSIAEKPFFFRFR